MIKSKIYTDEELKNDYNKTCTCKLNASYNRNILPEKRKF